MAQKSAGVCFPEALVKQQEVETLLSSLAHSTPLQLLEDWLRIIHLLGVGLGLMGHCLSFAQTLTENVPARASH